MIKILVKTNTTRREVTADVAQTPIAVFDDMGVSVAGSVVNLNGTILTATDLNASFETLGIQDGSTVNLNSIVKADGAKALKSHGTFPVRKTHATAPWVVSCPGTFLFK